MKTVRAEVKTWATVAPNGSSTWSWKFRNPIDDGSWQQAGGCISEDVAKQQARAALYLRAQNDHNLRNPNVSNMEVILL